MGSNEIRSTYLLNPPSTQLSTYHTLHRQIKTTEAMPFPDHEFHGHAAKADYVQVERQPTGSHDWHETPHRHTAMYRAYYAVRSRKESHVVLASIGKSLTGKKQEASFYLGGTLLYRRDIVSSQSQSARLQGLTLPALASSFLQRLAARFDKDRDHISLLRSSNRLSSKSSERSM